MNLEDVARYHEEHADGDVAAEDGQTGRETDSERDRQTDRQRTYFTNFAWMLIKHESFSLSLSLTT